LLCYKRDFGEEIEETYVYDNKMEFPADFRDWVGFLEDLYCYDSKSYNKCVFTVEKRVVSLYDHSLVWCPGHKRIAPLSDFHGSRKRRLKD
jgi:hypothetical protein